MKPLTIAEIAQLRRLAKTHFVSEAAEIMGIPRARAAHAARTNEIKTEKKKGAWNSKHSHLREKVMTYFLTHTWEETRAKFGLTHSELKSLFTAGYRDPKLAQLRKDTRNHSPWTVDELLFVIRHSGIRDRGWMGRKLKRGGARVVKERLKTFNSGTKWLNGMPKKWAEELWGARRAPKGIKTKAGPTGGKGSGTFQFVIIPWTECEQIARRRGTDQNVRAIIRTMAKFQRWIHGVRDPRWIKRKIREGIRSE